jgi:hypothetical protein
VDAGREDCRPRGVDGMRQDTRTKLWQYQTYAATAEARSTGCFVGASAIRVTPMTTRTTDPIRNPVRWLGISGPRSDIATVCGNATEFSAFLIRFYEKVIKVKADVAALHIFFSDIDNAASGGVESCQGRRFWAFILTLDSSPRHS